MIVDPISKTWCIPDKRPVFMGIVNCTPDSFSDGVDANTASSAYFIEKALALVEDGAEMLDIGGESTRPGASELAYGLELDRVLPVIEGIRAHSQVPLSIDTRKALVARQALAAGACVVNDVSGFRADAEGMHALLATHKPSVILMHSRGTPKTMQASPHTVYGSGDNGIEDVVGDVCRELQAGIERLCQWGLWPQKICVDPGFGFAKLAHQSQSLLQHLAALKTLGHPVLVGLSRKGFLGAYSHETVPARRDPETLAALAIAYTQGFRFVRVHNIAYCRKFFAVYGAHRRSG
jgi:dihydropteroate synthase